MDAENAVTAPNAGHFPTMCIRREAYYSDLDRFIHKRPAAPKLRNFINTELKPEFGIAQNESHVGVILARMNTMPSKTEFLWVFAYANKEYDKIADEIKNTGALSSFNCFPFGDGEWIYLPVAALATLG